MGHFCRAGPQHDDRRRRGGKEGRRRRRGGGGREGRRRQIGGSGGHPQIFRGRRWRSTVLKAATPEVGGRGRRGGRRVARSAAPTAGPPRHGAPPPPRLEVPHCRPSALREKKGGEGGGGGGRGGGGRRGRWPQAGVLALAAEPRRCSLPQGPCVLRLRVPAMWMEWEAARVGIGSGGVAGWVADFIRWAGWAEWAPGPHASTWATSC
jgi:hypothetical protein